MDPPAVRRTLTAAALAYPTVWIIFLAMGYRVVRKGWNRKRAAVAVVCVTVIPWLAFTLARDLWSFDLVTR